MEMGEEGEIIYPFSTVSVTRLLSQESMQRSQWDSENRVFLSFL